LSCGAALPMWAALVRLCAGVAPPELHGLPYTSSFVASSPLSVCVLCACALCAPAFGPFSTYVALVTHHLRVSVAAYLPTYLPGAASGRANYLPSLRCMRD